MKLALDHVDMFTGVVLLAPSVFPCPRWLTTSTPAVIVHLQIVKYRLQIISYTMGPRSGNFLRILPSLFVYSHIIAD